MQYILFQDGNHIDLRPLTWTRPVFDLRIGITTILEKWETIFPDIRTLSPESPASDSIRINGKFIPGKWLPENLAENCPPNSAWINDRDELVFARLSAKPIHQYEIPSGSIFAQEMGLSIQKIDTGSAIVIRNPVDIFQHNKTCLEADFNHLIRSRKSATLTDKHSIVYGSGNIFLEEGAKIRASVINAEDGPVYIGKNVTIGEGSLIHGAHAICEGSVISMGAKLRGDSTFGPYCKVGGEVANSVIMGYSNKAHDGYLGNSVIGYWCNLGADTNTSNLKNNYSPVKLWSYRSDRFLDTGTIFCGLVMGDHSKCGINTMFNTGTVVGVACNIFGAGYPRNFIPDFSWGGSGGFKTHEIDKAVELAKVVMARRKLNLTEYERLTLEMIFRETDRYRNWEAQKEDAR